MGTNELMMWKRSVTPQSIYTRCVLIPRQSLIPYLCENTKGQVNLVGARRKPEALRFPAELQWSDLPRRCLPQSPSVCLSPPSHSPQPLAFGTRLPFSPFSCVHGVTGPTKEWKRNLPGCLWNLSTPRNFVRTHSARARQRSSPCPALGERRKKLSSWARTHTAPPFSDPARC